MVCAMHTTRFDLASLTSVSTCPRTLRSIQCLQRVFTDRSYPEAELLTLKRQFQRLYCTKFFAHRLRAICIAGMPDRSQSFRSCCEGAPGSKRMWYALAVGRARGDEGLESGNARRRVICMFVAGFPTRGELQRRGARSALQWFYSKQSS